VHPHRAPRGRRLRRVSTAAAAAAAATTANADVDADADAEAAAARWTRGRRDVGQSRVAYVVEWSDAGRSCSRCAEVSQQRRSQRGKAERWSRTRVVGPGWSDGEYVLLLIVSLGKNGRPSASFRAAFFLYTKLRFTGPRVA
jgi:hypothetical protein